MKRSQGLVLALTLALLACQPASYSTITIINDETHVTLQTEDRTPSAILLQAGIPLDPNDRVLVNGLVSAPDAPILSYPATIQIRQAKVLTLITPDGQRQLTSSAWTVGEALAEAGYVLHAGDPFDTSLSAPLTNGMTISVSAPRTLILNIDGRALQIQSSAQTVGEALAEAGVPLLGQDYSRPGENEALPPDGQIQVVRVSESVLLAQKPIPYESEFIASADVVLDQTQVLNPGSVGLSLQRIRIRYENGQEVSRVTENETMVRPPVNRVVGYGTKVEIKTTTVDGVQIEYWRAVRMFATSFSPCQLGVPGLCSTTTASGLPLKKGIAGMKLNWYVAMRGQQFYIPGYGFAVLADSGGPHPLGYPHIDLGYTDADFVPWHEWVTVYFITPVPDSILYILQ